MKRIFLALCLAIAISCSHQDNPSSPVSDDPGEGQEQEQEQEQEQGNNPSEKEDPSVEGSIPAIPVLAPSMDKAVDVVSLTPEQEVFQQSASLFAFKLMAKLYNGHSIVFSPLSIQMALSMVLNGAVGETAQEIFDVLCYEKSDIDVLNSYAKSLLEQLSFVDTSIKMQMADCLIVNDHYLLLPEYQERMGTFYYAPVINLPFSDDQAVMDAVNAWSDKSTNGLIPNLLDNVSSSAVIYVLNSLYLKAGWSIPFDEEFQLIHNEPFYTEEGTINVDYMATGETLGYAEGDSFQLVARPLGEKGVYMMAVLLPKQSISIDTVLEECQMKGWKDICAMRQSTFVHLMLPKFQTDSSYELADALQLLGMRRAFGEDAQFTEMISQGAPFISRVCQKTKIAVNENGVEAASASMVEMEVADNGEDGPKPVLFHADHPFIYTIYEQTSGTILFTGVFDGR